MHLSLRQPRKHRRLARHAGAVVALEFGIIAPVMALMVIGVFDISKAAILWEQVWAASRSISESAATLAIQPDGSAQLTEAQATQALSLVLADIPWLREGIATKGETSTNAGHTVSAVLTSVDYEIAAGCTSQCDYQATVKWSKAFGYAGFNTGSAVLRPCGSGSHGAQFLGQVTPGTPQSLGTIATKDAENLPLSGISVPDAFLMADVKLTYKPYFFNFISRNGITFWATSYWPVRSNVPSTLTNWATIQPAPPDGNKNDLPAQQCT